MKKRYAFLLVLKDRSSITMNNNRVVAKIQNTEYSLMGTVDQIQMDKISAKVDDMIDKVKNSNSILDGKMIYLISCLNFAD